VKDKDPRRGDSLAESDVVHAVWDEIGGGGQLVEEFVVPTIADQPLRARRIDGVFVTGGPRLWHKARTPLALRGCDVVVCQAKAGELDLGVLGQTLFAAKLIERVHGPHDLRLIAAAVKPNPVIERLLESYRPLGWNIEYRVYSNLTPGQSSRADARPAKRLEMASSVHREVGGLLITGARRGPANFKCVRAAATGEPLRHADPDAVILPNRRIGVANATSTVEVAAKEPVVLVYASTDLYMAPMGRALFGGEIARRLLGLADVTAALRYCIENTVLRELIEQVPNIDLPRDQRSSTRAVTSS
jgi:hypothetical protein